MYESLSSQGELSDGNRFANVLNVKFVLLAQLFDHLEINLSD